MRPQVGNNQTEPISRMFSMYATRRDAFDLAALSGATPDTVMMLTRPDALFRKENEWSFDRATNGLHKFGATALHNRTYVDRLLQFYDGAAAEQTEDTPRRRTDGSRTRVIVPKIASGPKPYRMGTNTRWRASNHS